MCKCASVPMCVCVCVCACVRAWVGGCMRTCVCVCVCVLHALSLLCPLVMWYYDDTHGIIVVHVLYTITYSHLTEKTTTALPLMP